MRLRDNRFLRACAEAALHWQTRVRYTSGLRFCYRTAQTPYRVCLPGSVVTR